MFKITAKLLLSNSICNQAGPYGVQFTSYRVQKIFRIWFRGHKSPFNRSLSILNFYFLILDHYNTFNFAKMSRSVFCNIKNAITVILKSSGFNSDLVFESFWLLGGPKCLFLGVGYGLKIFWGFPYRDIILLSVNCSVLSLSHNFEVLQLWWIGNYSYSPSGIFFLLRTERSTKGHGELH